MVCRLQISSRQFCHRNEGEKESVVSGNGKNGQKNMYLNYTIDEVLESTFLMYRRDSNLPAEFSLYCSFHVWLSKRKADQSCGSVQPGYEKKEVPRLGLSEYWWHHIDMPHKVEDRDIS